MISENSYSTDIRKSNVFDSFRNKQQTRNTFYYYMIYFLMVAIFKDWWSEWTIMSLQGEIFRITVIYCLC